MKWTWVVFLMAVSHAVIAEPVEESNNNAFIHVNMTLELNGIENALQETRQSLDHIGGALDQIAQSDNLTPEQKNQLGDTIQNLNQLVHLSRDSVEALPSAFEHSKQAISNESRRFLDDLRFKVMLVLASVGFVVVLVVAAIGWFILKPMRTSLVTVTSNISSMAESIKTTAQALDSISHQQQAMALRLDQSHQGSSNQG